ncbi:hypothetical protein J2S74_004513 [Evansella vedderi]|uniref:Uncharacterized protein n=1 Tax=Evansella vedderi TaxID=38282 RepID=A0ABU0A0R2_9BACI|nr:hypothetical protein [Evansella vedderi]
MMISLIYQLEKTESPTNYSLHLIKQKATASTLSSRKGVVTSYFALYKVLPSLI